MRNILGWRNAALARTIKGKYAADDEFRRSVDNYVVKFQELLHQADAADSEGLLAATFLTSDVGKLYMVLARAIGRLK